MTEVIRDSDAWLWPKQIAFSTLEDREDGQRNMDIDVEIGQQVALRNRPATIRVWLAGRREGISLSRKDVAPAPARDAVESLKDSGLEVIVRQTGGTAVPQGDGVLHLSYLFPRENHGATTDAYYRLLCGPLMAWFRELGVQTETGALPGSYCDGTYNILVEGRKLVGTAQAWRGGLAGMAARHPGYVLAHACIMLDVHWPTAVERINRFYELAENPYRVEIQKTCNLLDFMPTENRTANPLQRDLQMKNSLLEYFSLFLKQHALSTDVLT